MKRSLAVLVMLAATVSCRGYDLRPRLVDQDGLVAADQYAGYGREQAQEIAIAREFARAHEGSSAEDLIQQAETATAYARTLPDVVDVKADPQGLLLTVRFKSGWRTMITPLNDGKRGSETAGLPGRTGTRSGR